MTDVAANPKVTSTAIFFNVGMLVVLAASCVAGVLLRVAGVI